jgi:hypothetical protein
MADAVGNAVIIQVVGPPSILLRWRAHFAVRLNGLLERSLGVVGASAALDGKISLSRGIIQLSGEIVVCDIEPVKSAALKNPKLLSLLIRHEQAVYAQAQQSAACFATHQVD